MSYELSLLQPLAEHWPGRNMQPVDLSIHMELRNEKTAYPELLIWSKELDINRQIPIYGHSKKCKCELSVIGLYQYALAVINLSYGIVPNTVLYVHGKWLHNILVNIRHNCDNQRLADNYIRLIQQSSLGLGIQKVVYVNWWYNLKQSIRRIKNVKRLWSRSSRD